MRNEFEEHTHTQMTAIGSLITAAGAILVGALGKKIKDKADEKKKEEVILETKNIKISKKQ